MLDEKKITYLREQRNWDQQKLAQVAGINPSVISRLERGLQKDFKLSVVLAIAQALNVSLDELLLEKHQQKKIDISPELSIAIRQISKQPYHIQQYAAGMVNGFLSVLNKEENSDS